MYGSQYKVENIWIFFECTGDNFKESVKSKMNKIQMMSGFKMLDNRTELRKKKYKYRTINNEW